MAKKTSSAPVRKIGRVIYGKKKSKSAKAHKGFNHFITIEHPSGAVDKNETREFYAGSGSTLRGARRAGSHYGYPVYKLADIEGNDAPRAARAIKGGSND